MKLLIVLSLISNLAFAGNCKTTWQGKTQEVTGLTIEACSLLNKALKLADHEDKVLKSTQAEVEFYKQMYLNSVSK